MCSICGDNLVFSLIILVSQIHTGTHMYLYMCIYISMYSHSTNTSDWPKGLVFLHDWKRRNQRQGSSGDSGAQWGSCNWNAKFTRPKDGLLASYTSKSSGHLHFQGWSCIYLYTHIYTHTCIWYFMVLDFFMPGFAFCTPERFTSPRILCSVASVYPLIQSSISRCRWRPESELQVHMLCYTSGRM